MTGPAWSALFDLRLVDPAQQQRQCGEPLQRVLLAELVLVVREVADGIADRLEAPDPEAQHALLHGLPGLLVLDVRESQPPPARLRCLLSERLPHELDLGDVPPVDLLL